MSSLLAILSHAGGSLGAHGAAAATAGHNLQNAGVAGYSRQRASLAAVAPAARLGLAWIGRGVALQSVTRVRDGFLEAQIPGALAGEARARTQADALVAVRALDPALPGGISDALGAFYIALRGLGADPADGALRAAAVRAAADLAASFRTTAASIDAARAGLDGRLRDELPGINDAAARFADLNRQIRIASASGAPPNDLLDARLRLQDELVASTGAVPVAEANGDVHLLLPGGGALVSGTAASTLAAAPDPANDGRLALRLVPAGGGAGIAIGRPGGVVGGLLDARDGALADAARALDRLAFDLGTALNAAHAGGVGLDGSTGQPLFAFGAAEGAAARIAVDPALLADPARLATRAPGGGPGDGSNLVALIGTETSADPVGALGALLGAFGAATARAATAADHEAGLLAHLQDLREAAAGVSIDEELIELTRAQRAFEAVGKVLQTADEMLETLMRLK